MYLNLLLLHKASLDQEGGDVLPLIALQLYDLPKDFVLHNIPVAAEFLLEILEDLLVAEILTQPLHCSQTLLSIPLLYTNVYILLINRVLNLSEWICIPLTYDDMISHQNNSKPIHHTS